MATSNFAYKNVLLAQDTTDFEQWDFDDLKENLINELLAKGFDSESGGNNNRSYYKSYIARYVITENKKRNLTMTVRIGDGYYSGVNVDYTLKETEYDSNGYTNAEWDEEYSENVTLNKRESKKVEVLERKLIKIALGLGFQELLHVGTFSNGEAVYRLKDTSNLLHGN